MSGTGRVGRAAALAAIVLLVACSGSDDGSSPTPTPTGPRPSSTGVLKIVHPSDGELVRGTRVRLEVSLQGARLVPATSTNLQPDEGHLHVSVDGQLVTMTSGLEQTLPPLSPGDHLVQVEFVANDHAPFDPRVIAAVSFRMKAK
jgi:hypothetical protein